MHNKVRTAMILCLLTAVVVAVSAQELDFFVYLPDVNRVPVTSERPTPSIPATMRPTVTSPWLVPPMEE